VFRILEGQVPGFDLRGRLWAEDRAQQVSGLRAERAIRLRDNQRAQQKEQDKADGASSAQMEMVGKMRSACVAASRSAKESASAT
jgi:hypothetical protein